MFHPRFQNGGGSNLTRTFKRNEPHPSVGRLRGLARELHAALRKSTARILVDFFNLLLSSGSLARFISFSVREEEFQTDSGLHSTRSTSPLLPCFRAPSVTNLDVDVLLSRWTSRTRPSITHTTSGIVTLKCKTDRVRQV
jgi:hypothetical protein